MFHGHEDDPGHDHWCTVGVTDTSRESAFFTGDGFIAVEKKVADDKVYQFRSSYVLDEVLSREPSLPTAALTDEEKRCFRPLTEKV